MTYGKNYKPVTWRCDAPSAFPLNPDRPYCRRNVRWQGDKCWQHRGGYVPSTPAARITSMFDIATNDLREDDPVRELLVALRTAVLEVVAGR